VTLDASDVQSTSKTRRLELQRIVDLDEPEACPHVGCRKVFRKVLVVSDPAKHPTRTFCACPYCLSKVTIAVKEVCQHYFGYLKKLPKSDSIPDECSICPKITVSFQLSHGLETFFGRHRRRKLKTNLEVMFE
jgi:hypothetical protein